MASEDTSGKLPLFSSLFRRISSMLRPSPEPHAPEQVSEATPAQKKTPEAARLTDDPVRSAVLMFLVLILTLVAVLAVAGGVVLTLKGDKTATILFAVLGGIVKGILSITKVLAKS
jgi:hypothetical protein